MHTRALPLLIALVLGLGCVVEPDDGDPQETQANDETSTGTGDEVPTCAEATAALASFISANNTCTDASDCVGVGAFCYPQNSCGMVGLSATHDQSAMSEFYDQLVEACGDEDCGADPCGGTVVCQSSRCAITL